MELTSSETSDVRWCNTEGDGVGNERVTGKNEGNERTPRSASGGERRGVSPPSSFRSERAADSAGVLERPENLAVDVIRVGLAASFEDDNRPG